MNSPFLEVAEADWVASNDLAFAIFDRFPVTLGHTLVVSRRLTTDWWTCNQEERDALMRLVDRVRDILTERFHPTGFNVGFNAGLSAGQTVSHVHLHVIPRYDGDMEDPRGGVRHVIPERGNYLAVPPAQLVTPDGGQLRNELARCLLDSAYAQVDLLVAFVMSSGIEVLREHIEAALGRGAHIRLLTTDYLAVTDVGALGFLLDRVGNHSSGGGLEVRIFEARSRSFHPKAYLFLDASRRRGVAFVGSSNLSRSALMSGIEWNLVTGNVEDLATEFDILWSHAQSTSLTAAWLARYAERRGAAVESQLELSQEGIGREKPEEAIRPWSVQEEALDALASTRLEGHRAGLVVMATGLGKTWLAAFDSSRPGIKRVLFIAHRHEILAAARDVFRRVRPDGTFTLYAGGAKDKSGLVVFASIQSLDRNLDQFSPAEFDYIVVDEFHHAAAPMYRRVISHFRPKFMLGLTATPDRTDAADLLTLCGDNLVYECGLVVGLERGLLSPFRYRAIKDVADYEHIPWRAGKFAPEMLTTRLETVQRARQVAEEWEAMNGPDRRTIAFCCSVTHADFMADYFRQRGRRVATVHSGPTSDERVRSLQDLEAGILEVVFSVDLLNEGVDLPAIDIVLMLRPTESPIVFFQQLGRGLRRVEGKTHLDVLDLVGNHRSFLMKARLLVALGGSPHLTDREALQRLKEPLADLPEGCSIVVETEAVDLLQTVLGVSSKEDRLADLVGSWIADHGGQRPRALELALVDGKGFSFGKRKGGWFGFLATHGFLTEDEEAVVERAGSVLAGIEHGSYSKSFKLVTLEALAALQGLRGSTSINELALSCRWRILSDPRLLSDLDDADTYFGDVLNPSDAEWVAYWRKNPIKALTSEGGWFSLLDDRLVANEVIDVGLGRTFDAMVAEIVEYRLHRYLSSREAKRPSTKLQPQRHDGSVIDASFRIETALGEPLTILFESSGGASGAGARNLEYIEGMDVVFERLGELGISLSDAYVDSGRVKHLPIAQRRVWDEEMTLPISFSTVDRAQLRRAILRRMAKVGQAPGAKGGGNQRKALRIVLGDIGHLTVATLEENLVNGSHGVRTEETGWEAVDAGGS